MPEPIAGDRIIEALRDLPQDATFEDAIERLSPQSLHDVESIRAFVLSSL